MDSGHTMRLGEKKKKNTKSLEVSSPHQVIVKIIHLHMRNRQRTGSAPVTPPWVTILMLMFTAIQSVLVEPDHLGLPSVPAV